MKNSTSPISIPEIVDIIVSNLVNDFDFERQLTWIERRRLSACGLVSQDFYMASRRYLFATISLDVSDSGCPFSWSHIHKLHQILSSNPMIQRQIRHLMINIEAEPIPAVPETAVLDFSIKPSRFAALMNLVPSLRALTVCSKPCSLTYDNVVNLFRTLDVLRIQCPDLHKLCIGRIENVPLSFLSNWSNITDLRTMYVTGHFNFMTDMPLERFHSTVSSSFPNWNPFNFIKFNRLQYLGVVFTTDSVTGHQTLLRINNALPALSHLQLVHYGSRFYVPEVGTVSAIPSLRSINFVEFIGNDNWPSSILNNIASFLEPKDSTPNDIESIDILIFGACHLTSRALNYLSTWSKLDRIFTSKEYHKLTHVRISIGPYESEEAAEFKPRGAFNTVLHRCHLLVLPLTCASQSIHVEFEAADSHFAVNDIQTTVPSYIVPLRC
ncbi:hypothetical protein BDN70DRAFT_988181 [Pholiota conissans]|uniref:Uncharacterized protein n=1 Tax=Pholiota conissans TaxID=109636 RepID=A0A9P6D723_9AGAR|nr:hypothetical protein BDN70DRAFT_988181 [Pholiota conissans]